MVSKLPLHDNKVEQTPFALSGEWDSVLLRIQLSLEDADPFYRTSSALAINNFTKALQKEFCEHTQNESNAPLGDKFNLDYFHVLWKKNTNKTWASLIEVFKDTNSSSEKKQEEMWRKKLQEKILIADQIFLTLAWWEEEDILSEKLCQYFLEYVISLQKLVTPKSAQTLIDLRNILETEKSITIKRWTLLLFLILTQHQFWWKKVKQKKSSKKVTKRTDKR